MLVATFTQLDTVSGSDISWCVSSVDRLHVVSPTARCALLLQSSECFVLIYRYGVFTMCHRACLAFRIHVTMKWQRSQLLFVLFYLFSRSTIWFSVKCTQTNTATKKWFSLWFLLFIFCLLFLYFCLYSGTTFNYTVVISFNYSG